MAGQRQGGRGRGGRRGRGGGDHQRRDGSTPGVAAVPKGIGKSFDAAPPGHRYRLYWSGWEQHGWKAKSDKSGALKQCTDLPEEARRAVKALSDRQIALAGSLGRSVRRYDVRLGAPLVTGMGNEHPNENGFAFYDPHGLPYVPGSGLKGALRRTAEELALFEADSPWTILDVWWLFGFDATAGYLKASRQGSAPGSSAEQITPEHVLADEASCWSEAYRACVAALPDEQIAELERARNRQSGDAIDRSFLRRLAGMRAADIHGFFRVRGALLFWDAFPQIDRLEADVMTPHFPDYHAKAAGPASDDQDPQPHGFLVVPAGTRITLLVQLAAPDCLPERLRESWSDLVAEVVEQGLRRTGLGAKTSQGYGMGSVDTEANEKRAREQRRIEEREREQRAAREHDEARERRRRELQEKGLDPQTAESIVRLDEIRSAEEISSEQNEEIHRIYSERLDAAEGEARKMLARALYDAYERAGSWQGKLSKKQREKKKKLKAMLEDGS